MESASRGVSTEWAGPGRLSVAAWMVVATLLLSAGAWPLTRAGSAPAEQRVILVSTPGPRTGSPAAPLASRPAPLFLFLAVGGDEAGRMGELARDAAADAPGTAALVEVRAFESAAAATAFADAVRHGNLVLSGLGLPAVTVAGSYPGGSPAQ